MSFKRRRNIKLENTETYKVFFMCDFSVSKLNELEDYEEEKASGVEEDEENEVHLQKALTKKTEIIPIPKIEEVENEARTRYKKISLSNHLNRQEDVSNIYIKSAYDEKELDQSLLENLKKTEEVGIIKIMKEEDIVLVNEYFVEKTKEMIDVGNVFNTYRLDFNMALGKFGEDPRYLYSIKNNEFINFVLGRTLIRYEKSGYEAYTCFKKRCLDIKIKSKKTESHLSDKLEFLNREFKELDNLCDLDLKRTEKKYKEYKKIVKLIKKYKSSVSEHLKRDLLVKKPNVTNIHCSIFRNRNRFKHIEANNKLEISKSHSMEIFDQSIVSKLVNATFTLEDKLTFESKTNINSNGGSNTSDGILTKKVLYEDDKFTIN